MDQTECELPAASLRSQSFVSISPSTENTATHEHDSLFERCAWFYALCREYLFRDHTHEIAHALFPSEPPASGTELLELGCGPGFYACRLSEELPNLHTTGIDLSENLILRAESRARSLKLANCSFRHADAHALPYEADTIDAIVVSRLFLIVPEKEGIIREIFRVLRPGGRCFIAEPTSGFRTRFPLEFMWLLSRLTTSPAGKYREPQQADVLTRTEFESLVRSQPWGAAELHYDGWYQYAVCQKAIAGVVAA
jgi:ubiquinone/menaquinone biosynthesis C-methylase UbiE